MYVLGLDPSLTNSRFFGYTHVPMGVPEDTVAGGLYVVHLSDTHYYGGRTVNFQARWQAHLNLLRRGAHPNAHAQAVFNQYGIFKPEIVAEIPPEQHLTAERAWLDEHFGKPGCVNVWNSVQGTHKGWHHSEATKAKFRARRFSPEVRARWSESRKGHPVSEATRATLSRVLSGKKRPDMAGRNLARAGWHHTEDARQKIASAGRGRERPSPSAETRQKISAALSGRPQSPEVVQRRAEGCRRTCARRRAQVKEA